MNSNKRKRDSEYIDAYRFDALIDKLGIDCDFALISAEMKEIDDTSRYCEWATFESVEELYKLVEANIDVPHIYAMFARGLRRAIFPPNALVQLALRSASWALYESMRNLMVDTSAFIDKTIDNINIVLQSPAADCIDAALIVVDLWTSAHGKSQIQERLIHELAEKDAATIVCKLVNESLIVPSSSHLFAILTNAGAWNCLFRLFRQGVYPSGGVEPLKTAVSIMQNAQKSDKFEIFLNLFCKWFDTKRTLAEHYRDGSYDFDIRVRTAYLLHTYYSTDSYPKAEECLYKIEVACRVLRWWYPMDSAILSTEINRDAPLEIDDRHEFIRRCFNAGAFNAIDRHIHSIGAWCGPLIETPVPSYPSKWHSCLACNTALHRYARDRFFDYVNMEQFFRCISTIQQRAAIDFLITLARDIPTFTNMMFSYAESEQGIRVTYPINLLFACYEIRRLNNEDVVKLGSKILHLLNRGRFSDRGFTYISPMMTSWAFSARQPNRVPERVLSEFITLFTPDQIIADAPSVVNVEDQRYIVDGLRLYSTGHQSFEKLRELWNIQSE